MVKYQKTSIHGVQRAGKSIGLLFDIAILDEPCSIAIICKNKEDVIRIDDFLSEYLPYSIKYEFYIIGGIK